MWRRQWHEYSYDDMVRMAEKAPGGKAFVNPDDAGFYAPEDMTRSVREYCMRTAQPQPEKPGEIVRCMLESLGLSYKHRLEQVAQLLGRAFRVLHVVGGGSRNALLCQFTANATGLPVVAGPVEATVAGNVLVQALAVGAIRSPREIREVVRASSTLREYEPRESQQWQDYYGRYLELVNSGRLREHRSGESHDCKSSFWRLLADLR
jgi:sugar (pentulose or hexulose) kinase